MVLATALVVAPVLPSVALAAPVSAKAPAAVAYKNCTDLNRVYKGGVAKVGVKYNKVSGANRAFKTAPVWSTALYNKNAGLDRDKDGVACEKG